MFGSISTATPNTTVTSSFTADEPCMVGVGEVYTVRVNGQNTPVRPVTLVANDLIEVDVTAPGSDAHVFIPWTYNGTQNYFAVVSRQSSDKSVLLASYRNKMWYNYVVSAPRIVTYKTGGNAPTVLALNTDSGNPTTDLAIILDPKSPKAYGVRSDGAQVYTVTLGSNPLSHTRMFNGTTRQWFSYFLGVDGYIYQMSPTKVVVKSTASYANAKCIFSDGTTLFVGGVNFLSTLSDMNTTARTYSVSETITMGAAVSSTAVAVTASGKLLKVGPTALTVLYSASMIGMPCAFQNCIVVPVPEEYKLKVYNNDGSFNSDMDMGNNLPLAVAADRNAKMSVAFADSFDVWTFGGIGATSKTIDTFNYKVAFAQPIGVGLIADHYLREFTTTSAPNPVVTGVAFSTWQAPVNVDVGTGEKNVMFAADTVASWVAPNAQLIVNGAVNIGTVAPNDRVQLILRSVEGRRSTAVRIGNYAFDWKVKAHDTGVIATAISIPNKFLASQVVFTIPLPSTQVAAPVALSHGTMKVNGVAYNGTQPLSGGDILTVTINVPATSTHYYSMLSIADSQYALTINTAATVIADTQRYRPYGDLATTSIITVNETGMFDFPNYSTASVYKDGNLLTFPTVLTSKDIVTITHTKVSNWWIDERDTVLMGPNTNYVVQSFSTVNDQPVDVDFGTVHLGIPDFDFPGDNIPVISGLSDGYSITIYSEHMTFSVNGAPAVATPKVKNGDSVQAIYNVMNLWEDRFVKTTLFNGVVYEFGAVHIDPPLGVNQEPTVEIFYEPQFWAEVGQDHQAGTFTSAASYESHVGSRTDTAVAQIRHFNSLTTKANVAANDSDTIGAGVAPVSQWQQTNPQYPTKSSVGQYAGATAGSGVAPIAEWEQTNPDLLTEQHPAILAPAANQIKTKTSTLYVSTSRHSYAKTFTSVFDQDADLTYKSVNVANNFISSYGHEVIFRIVEAIWTPYQDVEAPFVYPGYVYVGSQEDRSFTSGWNRFSKPSYLPFAPIWNKVRTETNLFAKGTWSYDGDDNRYVNQSSGHYAYVSWNHIESVILQPSFPSKSNMPKVGGSYVFLPSKKPLFGQNVPAPQPSSLYPTQSASGTVATDLLWTTYLPLQAGGFASSALANAAGLAVAGKLTVETYQQPEGTFSYVIMRQTSLVCDIKPSSMVAKAWLLGGG